MLILSQLEKLVFETLTWFDINERPLTTFECWYYMSTFAEDCGFQAMSEGDGGSRASEASRGVCFGGFRQINKKLIGAQFTKDGIASSSTTLSDVTESLINLQNKNLVKSRNGFWQLASSSDWLDGRQQKERWVIIKWQRALKGVRLISYLPFVKMVAVGNSVAWFAPRKKNSDIDLFIVASAKHLWLVRLLVSLITQIKGLRRHSNKIDNRLCLSFYTTTDNLSLKNLSYNFDPYLCYWIASLIPLYNDGVYLKWREANNWVGEYLPSWHKAMEKITPLERIKLSPLCNRLKLIVETVLDWLGEKWLDKLAKKIQWSRLKKYLGENLESAGTNVVVNEQMIKMHTNDRRAELALLFIDKLKGLKLLE
ncbi:MAG: hypothetical protein AAB657_04735 [Patescibacteria group bacterium]